MWWGVVPDIPSTVQQSNNSAVAFDLTGLCGSHASAFGNAYPTAKLMQHAQTCFCSTITSGGILIQVLRVSALEPGSQTRLKPSNHQTI